MQQEEHGAVANIRQPGAVAPRRPLPVLLHLLAYLLPVTAKGRIAHHVVEHLAGQQVGRERVLALDVLRGLALHQHVGLGDGVGLLIEFLAVEVDAEVRLDGRKDMVLRGGEHAAGTTRRVVDVDLTHLRKLRTVGLEQKLDHQPDDVARGVELPRCLVLQHLELVYEVFIDGAHAVVVHVSGRQVNTSENACVTLSSRRLRARVS